MYRPIDIEFWQDEFILELSPEHKLTYLFLLTNRRTSQCGIYNIGLTIAQLELKFPEEKIQQHLKFFQERGKILYSEENKELMLLNWYKYNNIHNHKNIRICINKELKRIKTTEFINTFYEICKGICKEEPALLKELFKDVEVSDEKLEIEIETKSERETKSQREIKSEIEIKTETNRETEAETKNEEDLEEKANVNCKENKDKPSDKISNKNKILQAFKNNFHLPSSIEIQKLNQWVEDMGEPLVLKALEEAVCVNKRNLNYVSGILNNWLTEGVTTVKEAEDAIKKYREFKKTTLVAQKEDNAGTRIYSKNLEEVDFEKE